MADITITLSGGEPAAVPAGTTVQNALASLLSNKQRKLTVAAKIGDAIVDFTRPLTEDTVLVPVQIGSDEALEVLRHSSAHVMAHAVREFSAKT